MDRPAVDALLAAADGRTFNLQYELDGRVPLYDRALEAPLSGSAAISADVRRPSADTGLCPLAGSLECT